MELELKGDIRSHVEVGVVYEVIVDPIFEQAIWEGEGSDGEGVLNAANLEADDTEASFLGCVRC